MTATPDIFGCVLWDGRVDRNGYGLRGRELVHVDAFIAAGGDIPEGQVLDHLCRRPRCYAPHHLEPVTRSVNELRKGWRVRCRRTRCPKGHDLTVNAVITPEGGRVCRTCNREAQDG